MSIRACGVALPFVLQVWAFSCCSIGDIVVQMDTGVTRRDVIGVLHVDGPGTNNGVQLVDGLVTDNAVLLVDGPATDNGVLLADGPGTDNGVYYL